jgi:hypothetical protein
MLDFGCVVEVEEEVIRLPSKFFECEGGGLPKVLKENRPNMELCKRQ